MKKFISPLEKMLIVSIGFSMALLAARIVVYHEITYAFYAWNNFLAVLPMLFSRRLDIRHGFGWKTFALLALWLAFFPNAPYMVTDIFHYAPDPPVPAWFDLVLVSTAGWNGLLLGIVSLMQVERFLARHLTRTQVTLLIASSFGLCGYGIYIGRFLRFNTWDVVMHPVILARATAGHLERPIENSRVWAFTLVFGAMFGIVYYTLKQLAGGRTVQGNPSK